MKRSVLVATVFGISIPSSMAFSAPAASGSGNIQIQSFSKAKTFLPKVVFAEDRKTFYCGCAYDERKVVDFSTCNYVPKHLNKRAKRIEWDHAVPAESFGQRFKEWREGHPDCVDKKGRPFKGRKCAEKVNVSFRYMQSDLYNLYPAEGELNGLRSNYSMAMIPGEKREFGRCDVEIEDRKFEPRPEIRGDIARTYLYMNQAYPGFGIISEKNKKLFEAWDREDPVNAGECRRVKKIAELQGNRNQFVENACEGKMPKIIVNEGNIPEHLKHFPGLTVRVGDRFVEAPQADIEVAKGYPRFTDKGPVVKGIRLTIMTAKTEYAVSEEVRVIHVLEAVEPGHGVYVMGPKKVYEEYVNGKLATERYPGPGEYDGRVIQSPWADYNYEVTTYKFEKPGTYAIQWMGGEPSGESLGVGSNVISITVR